MKEKVYYSIKQEDIDYKIKRMLSLGLRAPFSPVEPLIETE